MKTTTSTRLRKLAGALTFALLGLPGIPGLPSPSPLPGASLPAPPAPASPGASAPAPSSTMTVRGQTLVGLSRLQPTGATPSGRTMTIGVGLWGDNNRAELGYIKSLYDPKSAAYRQFLTPDQFQQRFGVPPSRFSAAEAWLRGGGLQVTAIPGSTDYLLASGGAAQIERLLQVRFNDYRFQGREFYANANDPTVPVALAVENIVGLNNLEGPQLFQHEMAAARKPAVFGIPGTPDVPDIGLSTPPVLWNVYDQPAENKGEGQQLAIFGWGDTNTTLADLRTFEFEYHFPKLPWSVRYIGPRDEPILQFPLGDEEWDIDTQSSSGMAPNAAAQKLYFGKQGTDADLIGAYTAWVNDARGPLQGSSSFSGCEQFPYADRIPNDPVQGTPLAGTLADPGPLFFFGNPNQDLWDRALEQAVAEGRTMFASAGDTGAGCGAIALELNGATLVPTVPLGYPAVSTWAVGVGGTVLYYDDATSARVDEYAWNFGGGGQSLFEPASPWQADSGVAQVHCATRPFGEPYPGVPPICRAIPDVAAQSGDISGNGFTITMGQNPDQGGGGTSLSSPLWLGMWARIQAAAPNRAGLGFANASIYRQGVANTRDFFDIGGASTQTHPNCNGQYCSTPGWDYTTGFGAPDVRNLMLDLDGKTTPTFRPRLQPISNSLPTPGGANGGTCAGTQIADPAGDAIDNYPGGGGENLAYYDIRGVRFAPKDASTLEITMTLNDLEVAAAPPVQDGGSWVVYWYQGSQEYFAEADSTGSQFSYSDGSITKGSPNFGATGPTGTATTGPGGTIVWDVPLSDIGGPARGTAIRYPFAETWGDIGAGGVGLGLLRYTAVADRAPNVGFGATTYVGGSGYCPRPKRGRGHTAALATVGLGGQGMASGAALVAAVDRIWADGRTRLAGGLSLLVILVAGAGLLRRRRQLRTR